MAACGSSAPPVATTHSAAETPGALPPAPAGFAWKDHKGDIALAEPADANIQDYTCEVWNTKEHRKIAVLTGSNVAAGGAEPTCYQLSPRGGFVEWGNGRATVWKNMKDETTSCFGVMAPDESSCVELDTVSMMLVGKDEPGGATTDADLDLRWTKPVVDGPQKVVATIHGGLKRNRLDERWWTVTYCSPEKAVIDIRGGMRVIVAAKTGDAKTVQVKANEPAC